MKVGTIDAGRDQKRCQQRWVIAEEDDRLRLRDLLVWPGQVALPLERDLPKESLATLVESVLADVAIEVGGEPEERWNGIEGLQQGKRDPQQT